MLVKLDKCGCWRTNALLLKHFLWRLKATQPDKSSYKDKKRNAVWCKLTEVVGGSCELFIYTVSKHTASNYSILFHLVLFSAALMFTVTCETKCFCGNSNITRKSHAVALPCWQYDKCVSAYLLAGINTPIVTNEKWWRWLLAESLNTQHPVLHLPRLKLHGATIINTCVWQVKLSKLSAQQPELLPGFKHKHTARLRTET